MSAPGATGPAPTEGNTAITAAPEDRQKTQTELEQEESRRQAALRNARLYGSPTNNTGTNNVVPFRRDPAPDADESAELQAQETATAKEQNEHAEASPVTPNKQQQGAKVGQATQSGRNLPDFDHATALEFYKAVEPSAFILGFKQGRHVTSVEDFQVLAKEADDKHQHLFFHVATVKPTWTSGTTAKKDQILECPYLWGDFDAKKYTSNDPIEAARHYESEGSRVIAAIDKGLIDLGITPFAIWRSGAGWQFLIKLDHAIKPDEAETLVGKLHSALGFDPVVRNCNRILRVPGSVNWKNGKEGRVPSSCTPLTLPWATTKIDDVRKALANFDEPKSEPKASDTAEIKIDWSKVARPGWLKSVSDLPDDAPPKLKTIIGHTGTLKELNEDLIREGILTKGYGSWSDVTYSLAASFKHYGKYTLEEIAEALLADLQCNQHIAKQTNKERVIERAIIRSHEPKPKVANGHWPGGQDNDTGKPKKGILNTIEAIKRAGIACTYDEFRHEEYWHGHADKSFDGEVSDAAVTVTRRNICTKFRFYPEIMETRDAITDACHDNKSNPVLDYFAKLKWDGKPRLDMMLRTYLGADDTPLNAAIGVKFMCAIVRRAKQPGCKFDHQLVVQGAQSIRKSMFCEDLAVFPDLFTDAGDLSADIKQQMEIGLGKQIIEFPEHAGFSRASRDRNKATLSRKVDRARMAYAHYATDTPRQWVSIATINPGGYLNDPTGERRYWHVAAARYDRDKFLADKDQIYAEAVAREPAENLWLDTPELVAAHDAIVATVKEPNELINSLADLEGEIWALGGGTREERVSTADVRNHLGMDPSDALRSHGAGRRIAEAMMTLKWNKAPGTIRCHKGDQPTTGYTRPLPDGRPDAPPLQSAAQTAEDIGETIESDLPRDQEGGTPGWRGKV